MGKRKQALLFGSEPELDELETDEVKKKSNEALEVVRYKSQLRNGIELSDAISCYQKAVRQCDIDVAMTIGLLIFESYPFYFFRRSAVISAEDLSDPMACVVTNAIYSSWMMNRQRQPNFIGRVMASKLILFLCDSPKNREADSACIYFGNRIEQGEPFTLPDYTFDGHTHKGKVMGRREKFFHEVSAKLVNESGQDRFREKMIDYLKSIGKYN